MLSMMLLTSSAGICFRIEVFHQIAQERGVFYAHAGRPAEMKLEASGVNGWEKILTQPRNYDGQRSEAGSEKADEKSLSMMQATIQKLRGSSWRNPSNPASNLCCIRTSGLRLA